MYFKEAMLNYIGTNLSGKNPDTEPKIMFGKVIQPHSQPWVVGLARQNGGRTSCGGTLISPKHVLTAGHCMYRRTNRRPNRFVIIGEHDQADETDGQKFVKIKKHVFHPRHGRSVPSFDLVILVLEEEVQFGRTVMPAKLPTPNQNCQNFQRVHVSGWGIYEPWKPHHYSQKLRSVQIRCLTERQCNVDTYSGSFDSTSMICAGIIGRPWKGSCNGDSGGMCLCT